MGFIVIRSIPSTFIARACLKRYENPEDKLDHYIISRNVNAHILGLDLVVETVPFIEQDKVLSVCVTSALWSFFNAHLNVDKNQIPSPYTEFYEPTDIVIGLYPKVRLPFATVWNFAYYLNENIKALFDLHPDTNESDAKIAKTGDEWYNILEV